MRVRRRHDRLIVNPATLTSLVTDAFRTAYERARQRVDRTDQAERCSQNPAQSDTPTSQTGGVQITEWQQAEPRSETQPESGQEHEPEPKPEPKPESDEEPKLEAGQWYHVSDTLVREVTLDKVLEAQAYMLFYERSM